MGAGIFGDKGGALAMNVGKSYYRIMLGRKSSYADECHTEGWFGGDWDITQDLSKELPEGWRDFNSKFIPIYLAKNPDKLKITAGLACGMLYTICKGIASGDTVLCPDGKGNYCAGRVASEYFYVPGKELLACPGFS